MKSSNFTILMFIFLLIGCSKEEAIISDCIDTTLSEYNMIEFDGQDFGCKFFLELFHYDNKQFFVLGNHCADMISFPFDCAGNTICEDGEDAKCRDFYANAERIEIIGMEE